MSFLSGLGNIFHSIGSFFSGGDNQDDQKKKQQQWQAPQQAPRPLAPNPNQPVFHQPGQPDTPQQQEPFIQLLQSGNTGLKKANPTQPQPQNQPQQSTPNPQPPKQHASFWHDITHNAVTDAIGSGLVKPAAQFGNALIHVPQAVYREVQNKPIGDIQQTVFGTQDSGQIAKDILGDTGTLALTAAAPGIDNLAERGIQTGLEKVAPEVAARDLGANLVKFGSKAAAGGTLNTGLGAVQGYQAGENPGELLKKAPQNFGMGAALGSLFPFVSSGLRKFTGNYIKAINGDPNAPRGDEAAPGVKSVNPTQAEDAAKVHAERDAQAAPPAQPVAEPAPAAEPTPQPAQALEAAPTPPTNPEQQALALDQANATPQPAAPEPQPTPVNPQAEATPPQEPITMPNQPGATAPAAPLTHDQLVKQISQAAGVPEEAQGALAKLKGKFSNRPAINLEDLKNTAEATVANTSDEDLLKAFAFSSKPEELINSPSGFALARAALDRFSKMDPNVGLGAVNNVLDAMDHYTSKSAQALRIVQQEFDNMPLPMKVRYIVNKIDSAWRARGKTSPFEGDTEKIAAVDKAITNYLTSSEEIANRISKLQGELNDIATATEEGKPVEANTAQIAGQVEAAQRELQANNGELVKFYEKQTPKATGARRFNDFARNMMLGSFSGRLNDLFTTANNVIHLQTQNITQGLLAKAVNAVKPGLVTDTTRGYGALLKGTGTGLKSGGSEFGGTEYVPDVQKALRNNQLQRANMSRTQGRIGRTIQAATEFATNTTEGIKRQRIYQLADQEAMQKGLTGEARRTYATARAAAPSADMVARADELKMQMNNLNNNPVSRKLNQIASGLDTGSNKGVLGGVLRNQILPFTSWLGGNMWNSLTDKNVVASFTKLLMSAGKGDAEGILRNMAGTINNAGATFALGYLMTQHGLLVHTNPEGYNDDGLYFHLGNRYVPVQFFGFFAPSMILGNAAYEGINNGGSAAQNFEKALNVGLDTAVRSYGVATALGADNNVARVVNQMTQRGSNINGGDALATLGASVINQYIPAMTRDINSVLDQTSLNPTHEKADTKATQTITTQTANGSKTTTRKDYPASALRQVENAIPGVSQKALPRKQGVASKDFIDRVTRGEQGTAESNQKMADAAATKAQEQQDMAKGIPNPADANFNNAIEARVERGQYDQVIEGYKQKLALEQKKQGQNLPQSTIDEYNGKIKQFQVAKQNKLTYKDMQLYNSTSLTEWRYMGDPKSDSYDPETYQKLWNIDEALAKQGVAGSFGIKNDKFAASSKGKYYAKKPGTGSGGGGSGSGSSAEKANKIGSLANVSSVDLSSIAPQRLASAKIQPLQKIPASQLIKRRTISVSKVR